MNKTAIAAVLLSLAAGTAVAQIPPPAARTPHDRMCADTDARIASRLAYIEAKVHPTAAQREAWEAFVRDSRAAAEPIKQLCANPPARAAGDDAAAALAARERFTAAMAASLAGLRPAVERFQIVLDEAQRVQFARALSPQGRSRHHR